ncbi:hypothetical protein RRG08_038198 [Elysia crispata]|uniref:Uncharacterized protein n=1 Tax=Elysia crispata TaxID=231223 RepID=A0AAE1AQ20_9GAST|nr:hypothetical protein RRG08_038198 [Elysia crispata]
MRHASAASRRLAIRHPVSDLTGSVKPLLGADVNMSAARASMENLTLSSREPLVYIPGHRLLVSPTSSCHLSCVPFLHHLGPLIPHSVPDHEPLVQARSSATSPWRLTGRQNESPASLK